MKAIAYLMKCTVKNFLKGLIKKPLTLIAYLMFILMMGGNSIIVYLAKDADGGFHISKEIYVYSIIAIVLMSLIPSLYQALTKFTLNIRMADVNLMMTSPLSPARILIYAQIKSSLTVILVSFIMIIQIPLLISFFGVEGSRAPLLLVAWGILLLTISPICMAIFVLTNRYPLMKTFFKVLFTGLCLGLVVIAAGAVFMSEDPIQGLKDLSESKILYQYPFFGWYFSVFLVVFTGVTGSYLLNTELILLLVSLSFVVIFKLVNTDFYEDAIATGEKMENMRLAAKQGKSGLSLLMGQKKKVKKTTYQFSKKGAYVLFQKQVLELRKTSVYFFNLRTLFILLMDCVIAYAIPAVDEIGASIKLIGALAANMYLLLLSSNISAIQAELDKPYIYLIPARGIDKLFNITALPALKNFMDTVIPMLIIMIYFRISFIDTLLAALCMPVLTYMFNFLDLTATMLFGRLESGGLKVLIKMMFNIALLIPCIIVFAVLMSLGVSLTIGFVTLLAFELIFSLALLYPAARSIKTPELNA